VKWHPLLVIVILTLAILAAGCTDEVPQGPPPALPGDPIKPGQVLQVFGDVTGQGQLGGNLVSGTIDTITFTIGLAPGAKMINMENVSIVYADAVRTETIIPVQGFRGDPPDSAWGILSVENEIGNPNNRLEDQERFIIRVNPKAPLVPRQLMTISIKTPTGTPLTIRRLSPSTILKEGNILQPV
jgi:hypothetical protein